jgi:guanylate kinase
MKQPKLVIVSAPSGAGKTTLCQRLLGDFSELELSVSSTTRPPRGSERNGVDYHFTSQQEFERQVAAGRFAEWALVHGSYYGTSKTTIEQAFARGKSVLLEIDVQGAASLRKVYPKECVSIFISPPSLEELERRLRARGTDSEETIQKRLKNARDEMARSGEYDHIVVNDTLEHAYEHLRDIVGKEIR